MVRCSLSISARDSWRSWWLVSLSAYPTASTSSSLRLPSASNSSDVWSTITVSSRCTRVACSLRARSRRACACRHHLSMTSSAQPVACLRSARSIRSSSSSVMAATSLCACDPLQFRCDERVQLLHFLALACGHEFLTRRLIKKGCAAEGGQGVGPGEFRVTPQAVFRLALRNGQARTKRDVGLAQSQAYRSDHGASIARFSAARCNVLRKNLGTGFPQQRTQGTAQQFAEGLGDGLSVGDFVGRKSPEADQQVERLGVSFDVVTGSTTRLPRPTGAHVGGPPRPPRPPR